MSEDRWWEDIVAYVFTGGTLMVGMYMRAPTEVLSYLALALMAGLPVMLGAKSAVRGIKEFRVGKPGAE